MSFRILFAALLLGATALPAQGQAPVHVPLQAFLGVLNTNPVAAKESLAKIAAYPATRLVK